jgi:hypothetical protein
LRSPAATPPFRRFTFLLLFCSLSLTREEERRGEERPLACFLGRGVAQESIEDPRSAHSLLSFLASFVVVVFPF